MPNAIDVSIIIASWNSKELLRQCLRSVYASDFSGNYEVIVIDNGSSDESAKMVKKEYLKAILIENKENGGVASARNQGLRISQGRYCLLLDADAFLKNNSLKILIKTMDCHPKAGVIGPKLLHPNGQIQYSCRSFPNLAAVISRFFHLDNIFPNFSPIRKYLLNDFDHHSLKQVDWVVGACQIIRRRALEEIGFLDEKYFFACEDLDFCFRAKQKGWQTIYAPDSCVIHYYQRRSVPGLFNRFTIKHIKSLLRFFWKFYFSK